MLYQHLVAMMVFAINNNMKSAPVEEVLSLIDSYAKSNNASRECYLNKYLVETYMYSPIDYGKYNKEISRYGKTMFMSMIED